MKKLASILFTIGGIALILQFLTSSTAHYKTESLKKYKAICGHFMNVKRGEINSFVERVPEDSKEIDFNSAVIQSVLRAGIDKCPDGPGNAYKIVIISPSHRVFDIACPVHGELSKQNDEHKFMGIEETQTPQYKMRRFLILARYEPWVWFGFIGASACLYLISAVWPKAD